MIGYNNDSDAVLCPRFLPPSAYREGGRELLNLTSTEYLKGLQYRVIMHPDRDWSPRPYSSQRTLNGTTACRLSLALSFAVAHKLIV